MLNKLIGSFRFCLHKNNVLVLHLLMPALNLAFEFACLHTNLLARLLICLENTVLVKGEIQFLKGSTFNIFSVQNVFYVLVIWNISEYFFFTVFIFLPFYFYLFIVVGSTFRFDFGRYTRIIIITVFFGL